MNFKITSRYFIVNSCKMHLLEHTRNNIIFIVTLIQDFYLYFHKDAKSEVNIKNNEDWIRLQKRDYTYMHSHS